MNTTYYHLVIVLLIGWPLSGCEETETDAHEHHANEPISYEPITGLKASSEKYTLTLAQVEPDPAIKGSNNWKIHLTDIENENVQDAAIKLEPHMPQHDHVSIPPFFTGIALEDEPGYYEFDEIRFFMVGNWEIIASITLNEETEQIIFHVDATN